MKAKLTKKIFFNLIKTKLVLKIVAIQIQNAFFQTAKEKKKKSIFHLFQNCDLQNSLSQTNMLNRIENGSLNIRESPCSGVNEKVKLQLMHITF